MAFRDSYTGETDPGRWFDVSYDHEKNKQVQFRIRRLPPELTARLRKRYGKRDGRDYSVPNSKTAVFQKALAAEAWTDTMNCFIRCQTKASAQLYASELGKPIETGQEVCVDGKLGETVKQDILSADSGLMAFIVNTATSVEAEEQATEEEYEEHLEGNSESSSSSVSDQTESPRNDANLASLEAEKLSPASQTVR